MLTSFAMKVRFWSRILFRMQRCLLVVPKYQELTVNESAGKKHAPITVLQELANSKEYAFGYLLCGCAFYKLASSGEFVGDCRAQCGDCVRKRWSLRQVVSKERCSSSEPL
jgi:hypothetical protein